VDQASRVKDLFAGCLLGGAVGDALGACAPDRRGGRGRLRVTAHTQMSLFTAEGLVRAYVRACLKGICAPDAVVQHALLRWRSTQGGHLRASIVEDADVWPDGWLVAEGAMKVRRKPDPACLKSLAALVTLGDHANNDSTSCGALTRVAPVGLVSPAASAFSFGLEAARATHAAATPTLAAAVFSLVVALVAGGATLRDALREARVPLGPHHYADDVLDALDRAEALAVDAGPPTPERVAALGDGWTAGEALAIALYVGLVARDFEHGVSLATNHGGNTSATGSLVGQLLGVIHGTDTIPPAWLARLDMRDIAQRLAADLVATHLETLEIERPQVWTRYPGW
jgi:ADP-ribosylglycohydrolase